MSTISPMKTSSSLMAIRTLRTAARVRLPQLSQ